MDFDYPWADEMDDGTIQNNEWEKMSSEFTNVSIFWLIWQPSVFIVCYRLDTAKGLRQERRQPFKRDLMWVSLMLACPSAIISGFCVDWLPGFHPTCRC
jgi:hypothetical protein